MSFYVVLSDLDEKRIELVIRHEDRCQSVLGTGVYFPDERVLVVQFDCYSDLLDRVCLVLSEDEWDGEVEVSSRSECDYCIWLDKV